MSEKNGNQLGAYLKDRRAKLDPAALGFSMTRRRTPGLRREEGAQRANGNATWDTWLEQGRGGSPSMEVLDRIARALMLTNVEREHVLHCSGASPEVCYQAKEGVSPRIQRVLDALEFSPAFVKIVTWDLVAWNRAAAVFFGYDSLGPEQRNILRRLFFDPQVRGVFDWESAGRFAVAAFRADTARAGASGNVQELVDELSRLSPEFERLWRENNVTTHGEGTKHFRHPIAGTIDVEYSAFSVDGRPALNLVIYNPATPKDVEKIRKLIASAQKDPKTVTR